MMTLRCTRRLLTYFDEKITTGTEPEIPESILGCWYANLVLYRSFPMALCVNERTLYAVVVPIEDCETLDNLHIRLAQRAYGAVGRVGGGSEMAGRVLDEYRGGVHIAPTNSRSILGTMNDLAMHLEWLLERRLQSGPVRDMAVLEEDLNVIPQRPLGWSDARTRLLEVCNAAID